MWASVVVGWDSWHESAVALPSPELVGLQKEMLIVDGMHGLITRSLHALSALSHTNSPSFTHTLTLFDSLTPCSLPQSFPPSLHPFLHPFLNLNSSLPHSLPQYFSPTPTHPTFFLLSPTHPCAVALCVSAAPPSWSWR